MMMKRLLFILALVVAAVPAGAQEVSAQGLKEKIIAAGKRITSVECDFTQTKESSLLTEKMVSSGRMVFRRPGHLEWRYVEPFRYDFILDGQKVTVEKDGKKEIIDANKNKIVSEIAHLIISSVEGDFWADDIFRTEVSVSGGDIRVTMCPRNREMKKMWSELVMLYDMKNLEARSFEMHETSGDRTVVTFRNCRYEFSK